MVIRSLWHDLCFQARLRPGAPAVLAPRGPIGFAALVRDVEALAGALLEQGVAPDDMVGLALPTSYLHLLAILALDRLGIASMSFPSAEPPSEAVCRMVHASVVITGHPAPAAAPCRWITLAEPLRLGAPDAARFAALVPSDDPLVRVIWSSGTGGGAKGAMITRRVQAERLGNRRLLHGFGPRTRYLVSLAFSGPAYIVALATLAAGGALILPRPGIDPIALANAMGATMASAPPSVLAEWLGKERVQRLETVACLEVLGSHLPGTLAQAARLALTPNLNIHYGTTETAQVASGDAALCIADPSAAGFPLPWAAIEAVDAEERPLPPGREGVLRLRTAQLCAGYYRNDTLTRRNLRDGWFYPGDIGVVAEDGRLRVIGRLEDAIVRDGETLSPLPLEDAIRGLPGVRDVAVFPLRRPDGAHDICAALVLDGTASAETIGAGAAAQLGDRAPARMFRVEALPRNANGKVVRTQLVDWVLQRAADRGSS